MYVRIFMLSIIPHPVEQGREERTLLPPRRRSDQRECVLPIAERQGTLLGTWMESNTNCPHIQLFFEEKVVSGLLWCSVALSLFLSKCLSICM